MTPTNTTQTGKKPRDSSVLRPKALIGMVHVGALPGTPHASEPVADIVRRAVQEAQLLERSGFDAIIIENMHDRPYVHGRQQPQIVAAMTRVAVEVISAIDIPLGIQVLSGGEHEAIAIAHTVGAAFIRCENFVYAHVADEGLLAEAVAGPLLRYRRAIGATGVRVMCDIRKKHASHAVAGDLTIEDCAHTAEFCGADGVIVTGNFTGDPTDPSDVERVGRAVGVPVWVGSGVEPSQLGTLFASADALIVGSWIKHGGVWSNAPDAERCAEIVAEAERVRG
ncbi:MAG: BtpA/SgcQ family protein [Planctomycetota bacterium]|nr:BtpA/SgcQ family protein [Planctomycetota bacterium]